MTAWRAATEGTDLKLAKVVAPHGAERQGRQNRPVALALEGVGVERGQQLARPMIAERRRLAFAALPLRPSHALVRVAGPCVAVTEELDNCASLAGGRPCLWEAARMRSRLGGVKALAGAMQAGGGSMAVSTMPAVHH